MELVIIILLGPVKPGVLLFNLPPIYVDRRR